MTKNSNGKANLKDVYELVIRECGKLYEKIESLEGQVSELKAQVGTMKGWAAGAGAVFGIVASWIFDSINK